ncbi:hypothetical protein DTX80_08505 [Bacilli bacterium]|uniref:Uncharacterized protein n=1 Tax=Oceanobacillus caeni TaxID=405946 RepID=A0ABR5MMT8_9BACI|nr:hypothetical protein WH51_10695 [Bacilli bacterium VT-13-104]KPH78210.1 hypothetical protein AFL42_02120 [Oceanobacillus caeni]PZD84602.1 hypothetical protein DEJ64_11520 [Bacilli bacterium]PZD89174.1 hypothetical protein DEJ60_05530 [Bacilli bacterium]PZD91747.1 hypothetical protein DEJ66_05955 [Bacilli bacterium]
MFLFKALPPLLLLNKEDFHQWGVLHSRLLASRTFLLQLLALLAVIAVSRTYGSLRAVDLPLTSFVPQKIEVGVLLPI